MRGSVALPAAMLLMITTNASAVSTGPQPGSCGVPAGNGFDAEQTCIGCHLGAALNPDDKGSIALEGLPATYEPGKSYRLTFRITHPEPAVTRWGFQVTAVTIPALEGAGELVADDPSSTQVVAGMVANRSYLGHAYSGTAIGQTGSATWTFTWTAPASPAGKIAFFAAANAANADGSSQGDRIYSKSPEPIATTEPAAAGA